MEKPNDMLDQICKLTTNPTTLNALHACRVGHPLGDGKSAAMNYANAAALCGLNHDITCVARTWLESQAQYALALETGPTVMRALKQTGMTTQLFIVGILCVMGATWVLFIPFISMIPR